MNSVTLTSLALLKARFDLQKHDIVDAFICFAEVCLARRFSSHFSPEELKEWLIQDFGLDLPLPPVKLILSRMSKRGNVKRSENLYQPAEIKCELQEFEKNQAEWAAHYRTIVLSLKDYARDELGQDLTEAECESALLNYIDEYSIECVASFTSGNVVPVRGSKPTHWRFIVSRFANHISSRAPDLFRYFLTVLTGRMLANALLASDLSGLGARFRRTSIYVDTPLLLQILGVVGKEAQAYSREIFRLFTDAGAGLRVFSHTLDETDQVLRNAERYLEMQTRGFGNVIVALREAGMSPSDVVLIRSRIRDLLLDEGLQIEETPRYIDKYQIDEVALEQEMNAVGLLYRSQTAKKADINSVRSAYVLRAGSSPERVEDSIALVLTNNTALARAAYAYGRKYREFKYVSPVITDFSLANIVWIKSPLKHPNVPMHLFLTHCYSVLKPSEDLWNRFVSELKRLREARKITPEQHQYLRYELRVRDELMNLTLGDEEQVSEKVVLEILNRHEQEITLPLTKQLEEVGADHQRALQRLTDSESKVSNVENTLRNFAHFVHVVVRTVLVVIAILLLIYAYHPFFGTGAARPSWRVVSGILGCLLIVLNIVNLVSGFRIIDPLNRFCSLLESWLLGSFRKILGLKKE
jgi:DNA-binding transcriptional MerR regulator